jgi:hypothetical protein
MMAGVDTCERCSWPARREAAHTDRCCRFDGPVAVLPFCVCVCRHVLSGRAFSRHACALHLQQHHCQFGSRAAMALLARAVRVQVCSCVPALCRDGQMRYAFGFRGMHLAQRALPFKSLLSFSVTCARPFAPAMLPVRPLSGARLAMRVRALGATLLCGLCGDSPSRWQSTWPASVG